MPLSVGDKLGPYEILGLIGRGGMGEVYRAHDDRLRRDVAIKVSDDQFTERFTREARVIASLNHTNICHLYDVGPNYLVMEYVEGEDLKGPLAFGDALPIIQQLIDGIEAAHEKNIIHRDLKPANIKITPEGVVKILDFGLAKHSPAREGGGDDADPNNSPTMTMGATAIGTILGTAAYMAPEQAKGKTADKRSDIWSFGVILYELLTGRSLFQGETAVEILGSVLNKDLDISAAPARVRKLLGWCLEKDRKNRLQSIGDARRMLLEAESSSATVAAPPSKLPWMLFAATALIATILAVAIAVPYLRPSADPAPEIRLDIATPPTLSPKSFALSPDGKKIAYVASSEGQSRLWVRSLDSVAAQPVPGTEGAVRPFWSPDSRSLGFFAGAALKRVDLDGTAPRTLAQVRGNLPAGTWGAPDTVLFYAQSLFRVSATGGSLVEVPSSTGIAGSPSPYFLPGGGQFLFRSNTGISLGSLDGSPPRLLELAEDQAGFSAPEFLPPGTKPRTNNGWLLRVRQDVLEARQVDLARGQTIGDPLPLARPVGRDPGDGKGWFSVASSGAIAWREETARQLTWFSRSGENLGTLGPPNDEGFPKISPDGKRVVITRGRLSGGDLWILEDTRATRLTFGPGSQNWAVWSPDGKRVAFRTNRDRPESIYQKPTDGSGAEEVLARPAALFNRPTSWSLDGRFILYNEGGSGVATNIMVLPLTENQKPGDRKPFPFVNTPFAETEGEFSPDGKWVAYTSNESGQPEVYVRPFPGPGGVWPVSTGGGSSPRWRADGREMYYLAPDNLLMAVAVTAAGTAVTPAAPKALFRANIAANGGLRPQYDVAPDGRFLINVESAGAATNPIHVLLNWKPPGK